MSKNSPQTISHELLDELVNYSPSNPPSQFISKQLLSKANKLLKVDVAQGYMVIGIVHSLNGNHEETVKAFNNSLKNSFNDDTIISNFAIALRNLGRFDEAFNIIEDNYINGSLIITKEACEAAIGIGLFNKADIYYKKLVKLSDSASEFLKNINFCRAACNKLGISEDELFTIYKLLLKVISTYKIIPTGTSLIDDCEDGSLILMIHVDSDAKTLAKISLDIAEKIADSQISALVEQKISPVVLKGTI